MNETEMIEQVQSIFRDVLNNEDIIITSKSHAADIPEWDSLMHIQLIVAIENLFQIRFTAQEIGAYQNVGEMCVGIQQKLLNKKSS